MTEPTVVHATFAVERTYPASPARVFAAWADADAKHAWSSCHTDWTELEYTHDFRVGGREVSRVAPPGGPELAVESHFLDIVPGRRIVYAYEMRTDGRRISVSLATVELEPAGAGTRLVFTEQAAVLDGLADLAEREAGTGIGLDRLAEMLAAGVAAA